MIAINSEGQDIEPNWQSTFVIMLPEIEQRLRRRFRQLNPESREDAVAEGVIHSLLNYVRLVEQRRADSITPSNLVWYATLAVKRGRPAGTRMNGKEPLSRYAQVGNGFQVEQLGGNWMELMVEDKRASVPDQVAAKMDVGAWFETLPHRLKQIARDLAIGFSTSEVAVKHGVTAGRISQLRRTLELSWIAFQREVTPAVA